MGHRHNVAEMAAPNVMQPAFPTRRDHRCRFPAAGPITPQVLRPGIDLRPRYRIPSNALPVPEAHLDQILCRGRLARRRNVPGESHASRGWAAINARARERLRRYLAEYRLRGCGDVLLVHGHLQTAVAKPVGVD